MMQSDPKQLEGAMQFTLALFGFILGMVTKLRMNNDYILFKIKVVATAGHFEP